MNEWIGYAIAVLAIAVAIAAWLRPRHPSLAPRNKVSGDIVVDTTSGWMALDHLDGSQSLSEHLVIITVRNVSHDSVLLRNWGISIGDDGNIVDLGSVPFNPRLPSWLKPGEDLSFHMRAGDVRAIAAERRIPFKKMHAWVGLGDGRTVKSRKSVPLA